MIHPGLRTVVAIGMLGETNLETKKKLGISGMQSSWQLGIKDAVHDESLYATPQGAGGVSHAVCFLEHFEETGKFSAKL